MFAFAVVPESQRTTRIRQTVTLLIWAGALLIVRSLLA